MKQIPLLLLCAVSILGCGQKRNVAKANQETDAWRYEIESVSVGQDGSSIVKVWSYSKDPSVAMEQAKKNAVHGVIFKGVPNKDRMPGKRPLVENTAKASEHAAFFKSFFADGGDYMRYVTLTNSGAIESSDLMKVGKKEYRVGVKVNVNYNNLRRYLESKEIIRKLDSGF